MADQDNPETTPAPDAPAADAPDTAGGPQAAEPTAVAETPAPAAAPAAPAEPAAPPPTPQERRVAARAKRGKRRPATPEERAELRSQKAAARRRRRLQERERKTTKGEGTPPAEREPGTPQMRLGKVVSDKADKTITVRIDIAKRHRRYRKIVRSSSTVHVHDESNDANEGDLVRVVECRPMSRSKRWRLVEILERAK
jgi:small subunit ribosomal protein S17